MQTREWYETTHAEGGRKLPVDIFGLLLQLLAFFRHTFHLWSHLMIPPPSLASLNYDFPI